MKILDYAWNTATSIGQRDYDTLRLILSDNLESPLLGGDQRGYVIKLPTPRETEDGHYAIQGLLTNHDPASWAMLWRLFKASLFHNALHAAHSDFKSYAKWAKGKDVTTATYSVSLVEDLYVTLHGMSRWPGIVSDIVYANCISALRVRDLDSVSSQSLRYASKLLLDVWGVSQGKSSDAAEDGEVGALSNDVRSIIQSALKLKGEERKRVMVSAADIIYKHVPVEDRLREIPSLPYAEAHGGCSIFENGLVSKRGDTVTLMKDAFANLGLSYNKEDEKTSAAEAKEAYVDKQATDQQLAKIKTQYDDLIETTRLDAIEFPPGDYGTYLRIRSELGGPIKNIRDQLRLVRNVFDDSPRHEGGQVDTQAAMQVVASKQVRTDVFMREEPEKKEEAWAVLLDASKSISTFAHEVRGIATCLAEVVKELIPAKNQWAMYAFNNSLQIIKEYDEDFGITNKARIGGLVQKNSTLLPDAVWTAYKALASKPSDVKLLVVVSDGSPTGYGDIEKKLVSTIRNISRSGVFLVGVGVESKEIGEYFTVNCVLKSPYEMMKSFVKSYLELSSLF